MKAESVQIVEDVLNRFVGEYQAAPFDFLYESDLQAALAGKLKSAFSADSFKLPVRCLDGKLALLTPVKTEYPTGKRFDVAFINVADGPKNSPQIDMNVNRRPLWRQSVELAIELKYWQLGDNVSGVWDSFRGDVEKLKSADGKSLGVALLFIQDQTSFFKARNRLHSECSAITEVSASVHRIALTGRDVTTAWAVSDKAIWPISV